MVRRFRSGSYASKHRLAVAWAVLIRPLFLPTESVAMSDTPAHAPESALFSAVEVEQFDAADVEAGKAIGQMLSVLFLYTVFAMALVTWWTFQAEKDGSSNPGGAVVPAAEHATH